MSQHNLIIKLFLLFLIFNFTLSNEKTPLFEKLIDDHLNNSKYTGSFITCYNASSKTEFGQTCLDQAASFLSKKTEENFEILYKLTFLNK